MVTVSMALNLSLNTFGKSNLYSMHAGENVWIHIMGSILHKRASFPV